MGSLLILSLAGEECEQAAAEVRERAEEQNRARSCHVGANSSAIIEQVVNHTPSMFTHLPAEIKPVVIS